MNFSEKAQDLPLLSATTLREENQFNLGNFYKIFFKRIFDLLFCFLLLPIAVPLLLILMLIIKLDSKGPAIYKSERIGRHGKKFSCLKLRTMCVDADEKLDLLLNENDILRKEYEKYRKLRNDPRTTRMGKFLRAFSLDELPQIFNVLKGEMSFVGPRPIVGAEIPRYGRKFDFYKKALPGITGLWQVNGRNDISFQTRVALDTSYTNNTSFATDLKIIVKTLPTVFFRKGAY